MLRRVQLRAAVLVLALATGCFADASRDAIAQASNLFRAGKVKQAESVLRTASTADPNSAPLHGALGTLLLKQHNYEDAVQELGLASQRDPDSAEYSLLLSEALIGWKHYGVAIEFLNAVRGKFGDEPQFHYDLGLAQYNMNKMNEAQKEFQEAVRQVPNFERAEFLLAACFASTGDPTRAVDILHKLVKEHPSNAIYWVTLGQILAPTEGSGEEAVRAVRRALQLAPNERHAQYVAATVYVETGNFADARPLLERLERVDPKVLSIHVQLARVYSRLGEHDLARKESQLANELQNTSAGQLPPGQPTGDSAQP